MMSGPKGLLGGQRRRSGIVNICSLQHTETFSGTSSYFIGLDLSKCKMITAMEK